MSDISLYYLKSSNSGSSGGSVVNTRQSVTHSSVAPLSINWANGDMVVVSASANITGLVDTNRPNPGYVTLKIENTGASNINLDLSGNDLHVAQTTPEILAPGENVVLFGIEV